eukprot:CAMPEP_0196723358 /NCGR_PEP_ID=MMETSP1091-20130531/5489_1 /TAXON_ID=302021 /ORGANISM="Rhodomonas sp., Strain CCMP768" /LENGTH=181 /DNA_ID=CAMNT_0042065261 /DNA_START=102 /DNA_END=643 /DNA_ORIENTATION=+
MIVSRRACLSALALAPVRCDGDLYALDSARYDACRSCLPRRPFAGASSDEAAPCLVWVRSECHRCFSCAFCECPFHPPAVAVVVVVVVVTCGTAADFDAAEVCVCLWVDAALALLSSSSSSSSSSGGLMCAFLAPHSLASRSSRAAAALWVLWVVGGGFFPLASILCGMMVGPLERKETRR